jgi:hypothetical protein
MSSWKRPSEQMHEVLSGELHYELAQPAIQSACRLQIYEGACAILKLDQTLRKAALGKLPALIRPYVEEEVVRLWRNRNDV